MNDENQDALSTGFTIRLTLLAWLSMIGFDFFLHAGVLAPLYTVESPFLLPPERAFALIPIGYFSFLGLAILLIWLMVKINIHEWKKGALFGLQLGFLAWGSLVLGLYSIATASPVLLLGWFLGQTIELGIAGAVIGHGLATRKLKGLWIKVVIFMILAIVAGIVWQNVANAM
jgi:tryptophan-rich sensory protein